MQAVVAAGGLGTRLYPLTASKPKHVLPILDRTVVGRLVEGLAAVSVREVVVTISYQPEYVIKALSPIRRPTVLFHFESEPRGTAGGVREILDVLEDTFLFLNGDIYHNLDLRRLLAFHQEHEGAATIALVKTDKPWEYGIARLDGRGKILEFVEKPKKGQEFSNLINAGIYVIDRRVIEDYVREGVFTDFSRHVFPALVRDGLAYGIELEGDWTDVGRPSDLLRANFLEMERRGLSSYVGEGSVVDGEVVSSVVLDDVTIGKGARVERSLLMSGSKVEEEALVVDTILGEGARVSRGSRLKSSILGDGSFFEGIGEELRIT